MPNRSIEIVTERPLGRIFAEEAAGALLSLFPWRWRKWWESETSDAIVSGMIEAGAASFLFLRVLLMTIEKEVNGIDPKIMTRAVGTHGDTAVMALGPMLMIGLLLKPATLALAVTAADGYVRVATALISKEVLPSVWFGAVEWVATRWRNRRTRKPRSAAKKSKARASRS